MAETSPRREGESEIAPLVFDYRSMPVFIKDRIEWLKRRDPGFSIRKETRGLHRCSATLVSHVIRGKRKLTLDRADDFSQLLRLSPREKSYFRQLIAVEEEKGPAPEAPAKRSAKRSEAQNHLLSSWLHVYVKDACRLKHFRPDASSIYRMLGGIATKRQIERSLAFLLREGYLRRTLDGRLVEREVVMATTDEQYDRRKQVFHRRALEIAKRGIATYPWDRRRESAVVLALNRTSVEELKELLKDFYERLLVFAEEHDGDDEALYQVLINLSPIGGIPS